MAYTLQVVPRCTVSFDLSNGVPFNRCPANISCSVHPTRYRYRVQVTGTCTGTWYPRRFNLYQNRSTWTTHQQHKLVVVVDNQVHLLEAPGQLIIFRSGSQQNNAVRILDRGKEQKRTQDCHPSVDKRTVRVTSCFVCLDDRWIPIIHHVEL